MRRLGILICVLLSTKCITAQIAGIAGVKINAINVVPMPVGSAEFEPSYNFSHTADRWDANGDRVSLYATSDSILIDAALNLRMAYAFTERIEFGCNLGTDFSNFSIKYALYNKENLGFGIMAGTNLPFGFAEIDKTQRSSGQIPAYGLGLIMSYTIDEVSSVDFNVQIQDYYYEALDLPEADLFVTLDYGRYVKDVLYVASFIYQESFTMADSVRKLTFSPGVSMEMMSNYAVVLNLNLDLYGRSIERNNGFSLAFTMAF